MSSSRLPSRLVTRSASGFIRTGGCKKLSSHVRYVATEVHPKPTPTFPTKPSIAYATPTHALRAIPPHPGTSSTLRAASSYLLPVYARPDFVLSHGEGSWLYDLEGRKYLDFSAGIAVNALGHADKDFVAELAAQASKLLHTSNVYHHKWSSKLAQLLVTLTQTEGGLGWPSGQHDPENSKGGAKVFFANSGAEANEGALKIARKVGKDRWAAAVPGRSWDSEECTKTRILCFAGSFHGRSMGALSVTSNAKYQKPFVPLIPNVDVGRLNAMEDIQRLVVENTCAVIVEPIQGEGGVNAAHEGWLKALRKRCDEVGAVLIFDEIQCGLYRSGTLWAHSALPVDCHPDMVTTAKPLANGYPIGAVLLRDSVATMTVGTHGTTFGGSPLACALGHHVLSRLSDRAFVTHIGETSGYLTARLSLLPKWFPNILESNIRGRGFILGLGFKDHKQTAQIVAMARERGLFVLTAGQDAVRLVPSLNVQKEEVDYCVDVLESCLGAL